MKKQWIINYTLYLLIKVHYLIGEIFAKYQSGAKRTCLMMVGIRQLGPTARDGVFRSGPTIPTPTVCDSVSWVVEVSKGYQSVHIYV